MKDSNDQFLNGAPGVKHELCCENSCATCIENRGCIYDRHLFAAILNMEQLQLECSPNNTMQQSIKEDSISYSGKTAA